MHRIIKTLFLVIFLLLALTAFAQEEELTVGVGMKGQYVCEAGEGMTFLSTSEKIAAVTKNGEIKPYKTGSAVLYAYKDGVAVKTVYLTVLAAPKKLHAETYKLDMMLGSTMDFPHVSAGEDEYLGDVSVYISNRAVLNEGGKLKANDIGSAIVTFKAYNGASASVTVSVHSKPTNLIISQRELILSVGESAEVTYSLESTYSYSRVFASSGNESIAVYDPATGLITATGNGEAVVTFETENGLVRECTVLVLPPPDRVDTVPSMLAVTGDYGTLGYSIPEGTKSDVHFVSLDSSIVNVNANGEWTALKEGSCTVRACADVGGAYSDIAFTVLKAPEALTYPTAEVTMYVGQELVFTPGTVPEDAYGGSIRFSSSNQSVAAVDENGTITAKAYGRTNITAEAGAKAKITLKVLVLKQPDKVKLSKTSVTLDVGGTALLEYSFPRDMASACSFSSLDPSIAAVDAQSGIVTAVSPGSTVVTVTTLNGKKDSCLVTVIETNPVTELDFEAVFLDCDSNDSILLRCGDEYAYIDSGNHNYGELALAYLQERGITHLKYYIGTHAHLDHIGGGTLLLANLDVDAVIVPHSRVKSQMLSCGWSQEETDAVYLSTFCVVEPGDRFYLGDALFTCIGPISYQQIEPTNVAENANSLVLRVDIGEKSMLLTGDATTNEMKQVIKAYPELVVTDLFKNPHHSAELSAEVVQSLHPEIVVVSTTSLRIPSQEYHDLFGGAKFYITATRVNGNVSVFCDGHDFRVEPFYEDNTAAWNAEHGVK